jgi:glycosyltransferase involved in cell wall biosynthesis
MKISYLSTFYPLRGGIAQFNAALYRELEKAHAVDAVTFKRQYPNILFPGKTQYVTDEDNPEIIDSRELLDSVSPFNWISTARKLKKDAPDLLIMKFWIPYFGPSLGYVAKNIGKNTKSIAILDNVIPHESRFMDMALIKFFLKRVDGFVVMSEKVKEDLLKLKPDAKYVYKQHPLYDHFGDKFDKLDACEKLGIDPQKKTLLFFGFIRDYKGLDLLIDAFGGLDESYQLIIAGESYGSFDGYEKQIQSNKNKDRIINHVKYIADDEVPLYFSAADVCVLPYKSATQSGITSIAYHFDLPMLATRVGGLDEMVLDNETGIVIPKPTVEDIKLQIEKFFSSDIEAYIQNIQKKKTELSWSSFAEALMELYKKL